MVAAVAATAVAAAAAAADAVSDSRQHFDDVRCQQLVVYSLRTYKSEFNTPYTQSELSIFVKLIIST